jgi:predicted DCC family thiol-disulfide oxidoreductase YuxK
MLTAVFDGRCAICQTTHRLVTQLDWNHTVTFLDLHNREQVTALYPWLDIERAMGEIHVIQADGRVFAGYAGVRRMLRGLPLAWPLWALLQLPGADWLGVRGYRWVARHRYTINRLLGVELSDCEDGLCKIP